MINLPEFSGQLYGYARASTEGESLDQQIAALEEAGVPLDNIFMEKVPATSKKRPELAHICNVMGEGDALVVVRLDLIGRSIFAIVEFVEDLCAGGILFRCLTEPIDTTTISGRAVHNTMVTVKQFEQRMVKTRARAGIGAAMARGVQMGPKHRILDCPKRLARFVELWQDGQIVKGMMSANDVWKDLNSVKGSKLPPMKAQTSYSNWRANGFRGFDRVTLKRKSGCKNSTTQNG